MRLVRTIARPMLAGIFVVSGLDLLADPVDAVKLNAAVQVGAGLRTQFLKNTAILVGCSCWPLIDGTSRSRRRLLIA